MKADGQLECHKVKDKSVPDLWSLKGVKSPSKWNWDHEIDCGDLFVSYFKTGKLEHWDARWQTEEFRSFAKKYRINFDRRARIEGCSQIVFFEVDRGTEDLTQLREKVSKYVRLAEAFPKDPFVVLFTLQTTRWKDSLKDHANRILDQVFKPARRGKQFLAGPHEMVLADPLGKVWVSHQSPDISLSVLDL